MAPQNGFLLEKALENVGGDLEILQEIAALFLEDSPGMLAQVRLAVERGEAEPLMRSAHTLKGSVANFGAEAAVEVALRLERMGQEGHLEGSDEAYRALEKEIEQVQFALAQIGQST
ncbi:MAG: Hpt domain-containing protein [bacterium]|nr:Hpt domain-containing protein [bacterium]